jgi:hypothetical protein
VRRAGPDPALVDAVMKVESDYRADTIGMADEIDLMQVRRLLVHGFGSRTTRASDQHSARSDISGEGLETCPRRLVSCPHEGLHLQSMRPHIVRSRGFYLNQMGVDDDVCPWLIRLSNSRKSGRNCQMKGRPAGLSPRPLLCDQSPPLMCYRWNGLYSSLMGCPECLPLEQSGCGPGFCVGGRLNFPARSCQA